MPLLAFALLVSACGGAPSTDTAKRTRPVREAAGCWKRLLRDAYDGSVSAGFPTDCYRTAIAHLPVDAYTPLRDVLETGISQSKGAFVPPQRSWAGVRRTLRLGRSGAGRVLADWEASLARDELSASPTRFRAPSRGWLLARLVRLQRLYHFHVTGFRYLHRFPGGPRPAPLLIVTADPQSFVRATPLVLRGLDQRPRASLRARVVWNYEAFFLEARDRFGAPFLVVFDNWRSPHPGGGQWARTESLYPFPHG